MLRVPATRAHPCDRVWLSSPDILTSLILPNSLWALSGIACFSPSPPLNLAPSSSSPHLRLKYRRPFASLHPRRHLLHQDFRLGPRYRRPRSRKRCTSTMCLSGKRQRRLAGTRRCAGWKNGWRACGEDSRSRTRGGRSARSRRWMSCVAIILCHSVLVESEGPGDIGRWRKGREDDARPQNAHRL